MGVLHRTWITTGSPPKRGLESLAASDGPKGKPALPEPGWTPGVQLRAVVADWSAAVEGVALRSGMTSLKVATRGAGLAHDLELLPLLMRAAEAPRLPAPLLVGEEEAAGARRATVLLHFRHLPRPEQRRLWNLRGSEMNSQQAIKA